MEKEQKVRGTLLPGIILITVGIAFLLPEMHILESQDVWPLFILAPGLGFIAMYITAKEKTKNSGLLIPGFITSLIGIFFFYLNFTNWDKMAYLWPIFPLIVGVSFYSFYFGAGQEKKDRGILIPATILSLVGIFFLVFARFSYSLWPILLIAGGLLMLAPNILRPKKDQKESKDEEQK